MATASAAVSKNWGLAIKNGKCNGGLLQEAQMDRADAVADAGTVKLLQIEPDSNSIWII